MRKTGEERAITLIALIITIVVLLILAVVAINAVTGDGIIQHASNAKTEYEKAQKEENSVLEYYQEYLDTKGDLGPWKQDGNKIYMENSEGEITVELEIGTTVNYDATAGVTDNKLLTYTSEENVNEVTDQTFTATRGTWKVLGIKHGRILLMAANDIKTDANKYYNIGNEVLYLVGVEELNNICKIYGHGTGAESARSITADDVNKITGYNPEVHGNGRVDIAEYGNIVTYIAEEGKITYSSSNGSGSGTVVDKSGNITNYIYHIQDGEWIKDILDEVGESRSFTIDSYSYASSQASSSATDRKINMNMNSNSKEYTMLFKNESDLTEASYYLASKVIGVREDYIYSRYYGLRFVKSGGVGAVTSGYLNSGGIGEVLGIRPVITLEENVKLEKQADGSYNIVL